MKSQIKRIASLMLISFMIVGSVFTSCSKDDDDDNFDPDELSIDAAVGTYKGTLRSIDLYSRTQKSEYHDAIIYVSKQADDKLKVTAKADEEYSSVVTRVYDVEASNYGEFRITTRAGFVGGFLHFFGKTESISITAQRQSDADISYSFEGLKQ